ncbi:MAG: AsmA family protein, partial [Pseudomonadota bacterium]
MRKFLIFAAAISLMVLGLWGSLSLYFNEQRLKQIAIDQVRAQTGRELIIDGALDLDFFPRLALKAEQVRLSGPDGFEGPDLFKADRLSLSLSLLPLIGGEVETGDIELSGAELRLHTDRSGTSSLDNPASSGTSSSASSTQRASIRTGQIQLINVRVLVSDDRADRVREFLIERLQIDPFAFGQPVPFEFTGTLGSDPVLLNDLVVNGAITIPIGSGPIRIDDLAVSARANTVPIGLNAVIELDRGPPLLARLTRGQLMLDEQRYALELSYEDGSPARIEATLDGERLNVDQLLAGLLDAPTDQTESSGSALTALEHLDLDAALALDQMTLAGLDLTGVEAGLQARNGVLSLDPLAAGTAGGRLRATAQIDLNPRPAQVSLSPVFELSSLGRALAPWGLEPILSGQGELELNLTAEGLNVDSLLESLSGQGQFDLRDGALHGIDFNGLVDGLAERNLSAALRDGLGG